MILVLCDLGVTTIYAQVAPGPASNPTNPFLFDISSSEIGSFPFGDKALRIWASTRNASDARQWQFRYDPLFAPEITAASKLALATRSLNSGAEWRTSLTIYVDTPDARAHALAVLKEIDKSQADNLQPGGVFVLPISSVTVSLPDLAVLYPSTHLVTSEFNFATPPTEFTIQISSPDQATAKKLEADLPSFTISYKFTFAATQVQRNWMQFSMKTLKDSKLFAKLNGLGTTTVYVHRDDVRNLIDNIADQVHFQETVENPADFDAALLDKLLNRWNTTVDSTSFDDAKWKSTYNSDDLRPNQITKALNSIFSYDAESKQWKTNFSTQDSANASVLDILKVGGSLQASYSNEGLNAFLKQHAINSDIEGNQIVAKSLDLQQVNLSDFDDTTNVVSVKTFVGPGERLSYPGSIELQHVIPTDTYPDLPSRLAQVGEATVPVGAIIPYCGSPADALALQRKGWWICDGRSVQDVLAPAYNGKSTPNLLNRFLYGATSPGVVGGLPFFQIPDQTITSSASGWDNNEHVTTAEELLVHTNNSWPSGHPIKSTGKVTGITVPTVPPYTTVIYLLRVR